MQPHTPTRSKEAWTPKRHAWPWEVDALNASLERPKKKGSKASKADSPKLRRTKFGTYKPLH